MKHFRQPRKVFLFKVLVGMSFQGAILQQCHSKDIHQYLLVGESVSCRITLEKLENYLQSMVDVN